MNVFYDSAFYDGSRSSINAVKIERFRLYQWFGGDSEEVTPVPMPNTEVKLFSADGSRGFPPVRVGRRQAILW